MHPIVALACSHCGHPVIVCQDTLRNSDVAMEEVGKFIPTKLECTRCNSNMELNTLLALRSLCVVTQGDGELNVNPYPSSMRGL
jgi:hypothetical protein